MAGDDIQLPQASPPLAPAQTQAEAAGVRRRQHAH
jgi:hypothetical protein